LLSKPSWPNGAKIRGNSTPRRKAAAWQTPKPKKEDVGQDEQDEVLGMLLFTIGSNLAFGLQSLGTEVWLQANPNARRRQIIDQLDFVRRNQGLDSLFFHFGILSILFILSIPFRK
jgi:hypothetical protein